MQRFIISGEITKNMGIINKLFSRKIEVSGDWVRKLYETQTLKLEAKPDIDAFFSQKKLPYLWPKNKDYVQWVDSNSNPQHFLKIQWAIAYFHHPDPEVLIKLVNTLPKLMPNAPGEVIFEHASLLAHDNNKVRAEAAKTIKKYDDAVAKLDKPTWKFCYMIPDPLLEYEIDALIAIGNKEANKVLEKILSMHLITERKAGLILSRDIIEGSSMKESLNHLKSMNPEHSDYVMSSLANFGKSIFGYGWGEGGVGEADKPWKEEIYLLFIKADSIVIKTQLERLVCLLCRYGSDIKYNPVAQLLDKLKPNEFIPLMKDYIKVLEGIVGYIEKHKSAILSGLDDELREAESGYDVKYVRDCQSQIKDLSPWKSCISKLESWLRYWGAKK